MTASRAGRLVHISGKSTFAYDTHSLGLTYPLCGAERLLENSLVSWKEERRKEEKKSPVAELMSIIPTYLGISSPWLIITRLTCKPSGHISRSSQVPKFQNTKDSWNVGWLTIIKAREGKTLTGPLA